MSNLKCINGCGFEQQSVYTHKPWHQNCCMTCLKTDGDDHGDGCTQLKDVVDTDVCLNPGCTNKAQPCFQFCSNVCETVYDKLPVKPPGQTKTAPIPIPQSKTSPTPTPYNTPNPPSYTATMAKNNNPDGS